MKHTNHNTVNAWVKNPNKGVRNSTGSIFSSDGTLYSYGMHYPMARIYGCLVLVNEDGYSQTTRQHKGLVFRALIGTGLKSVEVPFVVPSCNSQHRTNVRHLQDQIDLFTGKQERARVHNYADDIQQAKDNLALYRAQFKGAYND